MSTSPNDELRRANRELTHEKNRYLAVFHGMTEPAYTVDAVGLVIDVNPALERLVGKTRETLVGRPCREVLANPACRDCPVTGPCHRETPLVLDDVPFPVADGVRRIRIQIAPLLDAVHRTEGGVVLIEDRTALLDAMQGRSESEERYGQLFQSMNDGCALHEVVTDDDGRPVDYRFIAVNPAFERLTGLRGPDVVGRRVKEILPALEDFWVETYGKVALEGTTATFERYSEELERYYAISAYSCGPRRFAAIVTDVTERVQREEERRRMEAKLQQTQKLESLGVLAGGIAHDFNNLLMGILGNADLALIELSPLSPVRSYLEEIETAARRAADLARQMLAYSGKGRFVIENLNLNELVVEMGHLLQVSISKKAVLKYHLAQNLPPVRADATQVRQVVMNLITNASEAIGDRSGYISVTTGAIHCDGDYLRETFIDDALVPGTYVYLEVADTGCGMDEATLARVFDPFFTTKFTGRGLGLAAVLGIVRGHRGAVKVYSEPGRGTTFKVLVPAGEHGAPSGVEAAPPEQFWQGKGLVLLVDDEETVRAVGRRMLMRLGFDVVLAADGREALEVFRARRDEIGCVILDLTMPHLDGDATFRELRLMHAGVPVILSSGYNEQDIVNRFAGKGLAGFIQKPYRVDQLRGVLQKVLGSSVAATPETHA